MAVRWNNISQPNLTGAVSNLNQSATNLSQSLSDAATNIIDRRNAEVERKQADNVKNLSNELAKMSLNSEDRGEFKGQAMALAVANGLSTEDAMAMITEADNFYNYITKPSDLDVAKSEAENLALTRQFENVASNIDAERQKHRSDNNLDAWDREFDTSNLAPSGKLYVDLDTRMNKDGLDEDERAEMKGYIDDLINKNDLSETEKQLFLSGITTPNKEWSWDIDNKTKDILTNQLSNIKSRSKQYDRLKSKEQSYLLQTEQAKKDLEKKALDIKGNLINKSEANLKKAQQYFK